MFDLMFSVPDFSLARAHLFIRPNNRLAWNYVDLDTTLLSFERPSLSGGFSHGRSSPPHLENSIATHNVFFSIKRTRAHGGCLGAKSR
jgi:hypothetical protein